jgi:hypothetical protein
LIQRTAQSINAITSYSSCNSGNGCPSSHIDIIRSFVAGRKVCRYRHVISGVVGKSRVCLNCATKRKAVLASITHSARLLPQSDRRGHAGLRATARGRTPPPRSPRSRPEHRFLLLSRPAGRGLPGGHEPGPAGRAAPPPRPSAAGITSRDPGRRPAQRFQGRFSARCLAVPGTFQPALPQSASASPLD